MTRTAGLSGGGNSDKGGEENFHVDTNIFLLNKSLVFTNIKEYISSLLQKPRTQIQYNL